MIAIPPSWIVTGVTVVGLLGYGWHCESEKSNFRKFVAKTEAAGKAAQAQADRDTALRNSLVERRDAEHSTELARLGAVIADLRLRDNSRRSPVPAASGAPGLPADHYFADGPELAAGLRGFMARVRGRLEACSTLAADLKCARDWGADQVGAGGLRSTGPLDSSPSSRSSDSRP